MRKKIIICSLLLFAGIFFIQAKQGLSITHKANADSSKKSEVIAVAAVGDSITSEISKVAGRAPYFLLFDSNGVLLKTIKNPSQNRRGGASSVVVNLLIKESVKTVIAGRFGDKMVRQLKANKIEYHEHAGIAKKIVVTFIKNKRSKNVQK